MQHLTGSYDCTCSAILECILSWPGVQEINDKDLVHFVHAIFFIKSFLFVISNYDFKVRFLVSTMSLWHTFFHSNVHNDDTLHLADSILV